MLKVIILACSIVSPGSHGCGPRSNISATEVGKASTEAECHVLGRQKMPPDTATEFHKVICVQ